MVNGSGAVEQKTVSLPYAVKISQPPGGVSHIAAQIERDGRIGCSISAGSQRVAVGESSGEFVTAACSAPRTASFPLSVPRWQPSGAVDPAPGGVCRTVLVVGDSVMGQVASQLGSLFQQHGYCATVDNEAVAGTSPSQFEASTTWTSRLQTLLSRSHPDVVVAFFQGNGALGANPPDPDARLATNEAESLNMIDVARAAGVPIYWTYPMLSATGCQWSAAFNVNGYEAYRQWVNTQLATLRPGVVRVNANVLTPNAGPTQRGPAAYNDALTFPGVGRQRVRLVDCLHLDGAGPHAVAYEVVRATQGLWQGRSARGSEPQSLHPPSPPGLTPLAP
ncbi:MAG TPA: hypothetical protein VLV81_03230 [Acidimicrobiia bacterium]|nr:hypothetical protein [Acidimicrobiia bacterium]